MIQLPSNNVFTINLATSKTQIGKLSFQLLFANNENIVVNLTVHMLQILFYFFFILWGVHLKISVIMDSNVSSTPYKSNHTVMIVLFIRHKETMECGRERKVQCNLHQQRWDARKGDYEEADSSFPQQNQSYAESACT